MEDTRQKYINLFLSKQEKEEYTDDIKLDLSRDNIDKIEDMVKVISLDISQK